MRTRGITVAVLIVGCGFAGHGTTGDLAYLDDTVAGAFIVGNLIGSVSEALLGVEGSSLATVFGEDPAVGSAIGTTSAILASSGDRS
jgi:hypothetical protein